MIEENMDWEMDDLRVIDEALKPKPIITRHESRFRYYRIPFTSDDRYKTRFSWRNPTDADIEKMKKLDSLTGDNRARMQYDSKHHNVSDIEAAEDSEDYMSSIVHDPMKGYAKHTDEERAEE